MKKYVTKRLPVDVVRFDGTNIEECRLFVSPDATVDQQDGFINIETDEDAGIFGHLVCRGDYLVRPPLPHPSATSNVDVWTECAFNRLYEESSNG
jgi:hypothetical protein